MRGWGIGRKQVLSTSRSALAGSPRGESTLVRSAVLVKKLALAFDKQGLEIVIRIVALVSERSIAHSEIRHVLCSLVDQAASIPGVRPEAGTHARREQRVPFVSVERRVTLQEEDELALPEVRVSLTPRRKRRTALDKSRSICEEALGRR